VQLVELQGILAALQATDVALFAVSYDSVDTLRDFSARYTITYPLLADVGSVAIRALGLLDEDLDVHQAQFGVGVRDDQRGVCYPGVFVLDQNGVVSERRFQRNYRVRESGRDLLAQVLGTSLPGETLPDATLGEPEVQIRAHLDSATYFRYQRLHLTIDLAIAPGYHVYASPVPDGYTALTVSIAAEPAEIGEPSMPLPSAFRVEGLDEEFRVYEGDIRLQVPIEFIMNRGDPAGDRTVRVTVEYQVCSANTCFPPSLATLDLVVGERPDAD
jgi:peroxiredoxin